MERILILFTQEKLSTSKAKYWAIRLLAVGLLIFMYNSNLTAETVIPQKYKTLDTSKEAIGIEQTNLLKESEKYNSQAAHPIIIRESDNIEHSKVLKMNDHKVYLSNSIK